jgi:cytochrome c
VIKRIVLLSVVVAAAAGAHTNVHAAAPVAFAQCGVCHQVSKGAPNGIGPNLYGMAGKKAGAAAGFSYSPALKASKLVWNDATLDKWIANPMKLVPGNRMPYAGLADAAKRKEVVAYLKTLK